MAFRFVHAADIHLDSPLRSLALRDAELAALIGDATRSAFLATVRLCLAEQVDALLLSGDLYDGDQTSMKTARFLADQVDALDKAGIAVFIIRGNHDALSRITKELSYPESVTLFGARTKPVAVQRPAGALPIIIHGTSFTETKAPESLLSKFGRPTEGAFDIGILHTSLGGAAGHDVYAPCTVGDLQATGFRYWALGHIHRRSISSGTATIVMPGMPQGRDIGESGPKSVTLVTVADDGDVTLEERHTSVAQFEPLRIDLTGVQDWGELAPLLRQALGPLREVTRSEHLVARVTIAGSTPLAWRLLHDREAVLTEAQRQADAMGKTWIDKVEFECSAEISIPGSGNGDPVEELRLMMDDVRHDPAFKAEISKYAEELRDQLPNECRSVLGSDEQSFAAAIDRAARDGLDEVLARLKQPQSGAP